MSPEHGRFEVVANRPRKLATQLGIGQTFENAPVPREIRQPLGQKQPTVRRQPDGHRLGEASGSVCPRVEMNCIRIYFELAF